MEQYYGVVRSDEYLEHFGVRGQKWGIRRYQNPDGTLTEEGKQRYFKSAGSIKRALNSLDQSRAEYLRDMTDSYEKVGRYYKKQKKYEQKGNAEKAKKYESKANSNLDIAKTMMQGSLFTKNALDQLKKEASNKNFDIKESDTVRFTTRGADWAAAFITSAAMSAVTLPLTGRIVVPIDAGKTVPGTKYKVKPRKG